MRGWKCPPCPPQKEHRSQVLGFLGSDVRTHATPKPIDSSESVRLPWQVTTDDGRLTGGKSQAWMDQLLNPLYNCGQLPTKQTAAIARVFRRTKSVKTGWIKICKQRRCVQGSTHAPPSDRFHSRFLSFVGGGMVA